VRAVVRSALLVASPGGGAVEERLAEEETVASDVRIALQLADDGSGSGCLDLVRTSVEIGGVVRTVRCRGLECPGSGAERDASGVEPGPVGDAIARTLETPLVRRMIRQALRQEGDGCQWKDLPVPSLPEIPGAEALRNVSSKLSNLALDAEPAVPLEGRAVLPILITLLVLLVLGIVAAVVCCGCCMGSCCWHDEKESEAEAAFFDGCHSLVCTPTVPLWARVTFYVVVAINFCFFVSAMLSVAATFNLDVTVQGVPLDLPPIYDFSMAASTIAMLEAGVYLLGIILMGFSVIWPYIKLIILSVMFALPTKAARPSLRLAIMQWIDTLGKWSMFDVIAVCVCMIIFYVALESPATPLTPLGWYSVVLSMTPVWGMFANLIAQIISTTLSIVAIWMHHHAYKVDWRAAHGGEAAKQGGSMPRGAVMGQITHGVDGRQRPTVAAQLLVGTTLVAVIGLVIAGFFVTGFTVRVTGFPGLLMELATRGSATRYFTPLYIAQQMTTVIPEDAPGVLLGTWALIIMLVCCVLFVPVAQAAVLLAVWVLPMPLARLKSCLKANEVLASWQYMEVYLIAVIVGCIQIPIVCSLLVGDACDPIQPYLNLLYQAGIIDHATCFGMYPVVEAGLWFIFVASVLLYAASIVVREAAYAVVNAHDPLRAAQARPLTGAQARYYRQRARVLRGVWLLKSCGPPTPVSEPALPIASAGESANHAI